MDNINNSLGLRLNYKLKIEKIRNDEKLDDTFLFETNEEKYFNRRLLEIYKNLSKIENTFKIVKNYLDIRD